jgi:environmental stress-induced protein Ves
MKTLTEKDFRDMNWKNGKGRTLELIRLPHPKEEELFSLRLSIASMKESGPFSHYPGIERSIILLEGKGVVLDFVDEIKMNLNEPLKPIQFPGEAEIEAKLIDGPIREFNIMAARDCIEAYIQVHRKVPKIQLGGVDEHYCYIVEKNELILLSPGEKCDLASKDGLTVIDVKVKKKGP